MPLNSICMSVCQSVSVCEGSLFRYSRHFTKYSPK